MLMRAIVGIGEASYTTVAPTIIGDLFTGAQRSTMICFFNIVIPVGRLEINSIYVLTYLFLFYCIHI